MADIDIDSSSEKLVKSSDRVRDLGEVFTPSATVKAMLDMFPNKVWNPHPSTTFFEPSCGDGNFLVAILERKLERIATDFENHKLPGGLSEDSMLFHGIEALASIYAVDISADNVVGGRPGHEIGARSRLLEVFYEWTDFELGIKFSEEIPVFKSADWIAQHNILIGNMLPLDADGKPTNREMLPIIEYSFDAPTLSVSIRKTTFGDIQAGAAQEVALELSLFGPQEPEFLWSGKAVQLYETEKVLAPKLRGPARNGAGR